MLQDFVLSLYLFIEIDVDTLWKHTVREIWKMLPQTKPVRGIKEAMFDVVVDLRSGGQTYGECYGIELTEENKKQYLIPKGFAHGFLVLSDTAEFCHKCDYFYHPND